MKKKSWEKILNSISGLVVKEKAVPWKKWTDLLDTCDTSYKCYESLYWARKGVAAEKIIVALYNRLKIYTDNSFLHQHRLAEAAVGQGDKITLSQALESMISQANENTCLAWWDHILELLPEGDKRAKKIKWRRDEIRKARRRHLQALYKSPIHG